jgi:protein-S-isoprenylcysteine O-methyltransferase Ste14
MPGVIMSAYASAVVVHTANPGNVRMVESMGKANLVALLHALSGAVALIASLYTETSLLASVKSIKPLGYAAFAGGMLLFVVAAAHLRQAFLGNVEPVTDRLVTTGPYRFVRHPVYLGMFVTALGLAVAFRSLWGMLITLFAFVPAGLCRAKLEEKALAQRFGQEWDEYARGSYFLLPFVH